MKLFSEYVGRPNMLSLVDEETGQPMSEKETLLKIKKTQQKNHLFTDIGVGSGIGMVLLGEKDLFWMHAGGMPGYQSLFAYNPCTGIIIALAYSKQPKEKYVFISILNDINVFLLENRPKENAGTMEGNHLPYQSVCQVLT